MSEKPTNYYVPETSHWPFVGAIGLFLIGIGAANLAQQVNSPEPATAQWVLFGGIAIIIYMMYGWFSNVVSESMGNMYSHQMDRSFKQGMMWFIFSEVMFFAGFFGALFYARVLAVPSLGSGENLAILWPGFEAVWPVLTTPGGETTTQMGPWGLPLINTVLLITSSFTCVMAEKGVESNNRGQIKLWLWITVLLGVAFLVLQVEEYIHAYTEMGLTLSSGIYGNTFFMLTGFHGMHVTIGTTMLIIMLLRVYKGHFTPDNHFAFQATAWYWHFVDVVWVGLYLFVYIL